MVSLQSRPLQLARLIKRNADPEFRAQIGAVVTVGGRILSVACNKKGIANMSRLHSRYGRSFWYRHAEVEAVRQAGVEHVRGATIWVLRELKNGNSALARPCQDCAELLRLVGIRKVIYTTSEFPYWIQERL